MVTELSMECTEPFFVDTSILSSERAEAYNDKQKSKKIKLESNRSVVSLVSS